MPDWLKIALAAVPVATVVVTVGGWLVNRWLSAGVERLKHDLNASLASRARRADYLREQITKLYGPLVFFLEAGERSFNTHNKILKAYEEYFKTRHGGHYSDEMKQVLDACNHYGGLAVQTNRHAAEVLQSQWAWLDPDDGTEVGVFLTNVERQRAERDDGVKLPSEFYDMLENSLGAPVVFKPAFVGQMRKKLQEKQAELSGLASEHVPYATQTPANRIEPPAAPPAP